ncbi:uncharacterized protein FA14DRAFT_192072 [Meira miltonrushii]|uniref:Uncharacterized protein n=1 Tax=Meira miltonrushii TaxID=1280837 RepID=A0A316VBV3_9BASI|nr:uncharacterized protein FA14DRAFT_192072 [Meira miltonrushii]PWN33035.1 hypothetical protein FA14DRAFT_192072 [Meira miltonrushii]
MKGPKLYALATLLYISLFLTLELALCSSLPSASGVHHSSDDESDSLTKPLLSKSRSRSSSPSPPKRSPAPAPAPATSKGASITSVYAHHRALMYTAASERSKREMHARNKRRQRQFFESKAAERAERTGISPSRGRRFENTARAVMPPSPTGSHPSASSSSNSAGNTSEHSSHPGTRSDRLRGYIPPTLREVGVEPASTQSGRQQAASSSSPAAAAAAHVNGKKPSDGSPPTSPSRHSPKRSQGK